MRNKLLLKSLLFVTAMIVVLVVMVTMSRANISSAAGATESQSYFKQFVIAGGPIVWFVLLPMSLVTVFLAIEYTLTISRKKLLPADIDQQIILSLKHNGPAQLATELAEQDDFVSRAAVKAVTQNTGDLHKIRNSITESMQDQALSLLHRIEWISLIGNISPMVGLFGTVFGMIKLFNAIVKAGGQPQPAQLAGGISVALVTTFWGLLIAIPALAIHGVFRNRIEVLVTEAVAVTDEIIPEIKRSLKVQIHRSLEPEKKTKLSIQDIPAKPAKPNRPSSLHLQG